MSATSDAIPAPDIRAGDEWVYRITTDRTSAFHEETAAIVVDGVTPSAVQLAIRQPGSDKPPLRMLMGRDWSRFRAVNGADTVVARPLDFPLSVGRRWTTRYTELNPNAEHASEEWRTNWSVDGWETVETPAGTFRAMKIVGEGSWTAVVNGGAVGVAAVNRGAGLASSSSRIVPQSTASGRLYRVFWYAPEVKRWVKSEEDTYSSTAERSEQVIATLQSYKMTQAHN